MNHLKLYINLMKSSNALSPEAYVEQHHVFPTSIYGKNDRVVMLTAKQHIVAHHLLWRAFRTRYGKGHWKTKSAFYAYNTMTWCATNHQRRPAKVSAMARAARMEYMRGDSNPAKRKEVREKISASKKGVPRPDMNGKAFFGASQERLAEIKLNISASKLGRPTNYPPNRKSAPCSSEKAANIAAARKRGILQKLAMSREEFRNWLLTIPPLGRNGKPNRNAVQLITMRGESIQEYEELFRVASDID